MIVTVTPDGNRWRVSKGDHQGWYNTRKEAEDRAEIWRKKEAFAKAMWDEILSNKPDLMPNRGNG
jgi:phosphopantetheinyl transferase (holo-ACP synthase)